MTNSSRSEESSAVRREVLRIRGIQLLLPNTIEIAEEVDPERIANGVVIHPGCRLRGRDLSIGSGSILGEEAPVTLENCQCGRRVHLKGGFFSEATFLDGVSMGLGSHVRPGTLLEEEASAAQGVGFKQTILFPFVTTGSLINFCDCLMAGGTSRKDHSEVGSSYVHFNYTPYGDKATASLLGDVPRGVMLDQPPIFLGGQGGLVGPSGIGYGVILPAGMVRRTDAPDGRAVHFEEPMRVRPPRAFTSGTDRPLGHILRRNLLYIGNLLALHAWYQEVRSRSLTRDSYDCAVQKGGILRIEQGIQERIRRLDELSQCLDPSRRMPGSEASLFLAQWPGLRERLKAVHPSEVGSSALAVFLTAWESTPGGRDHPERIQSLSEEARRAGTQWLQSIVDVTVALGAELDAGFRAHPA